MANTLKNKTSPKPNSAQLKPEKVEQVTVRQIVQDERAHKIAGAVSLLFCVFLFIAFTSYLFTWQQDQSQIVNSGIKIFSTTDVRVNNLLGVLGAYTAYNLMYNGFGIAAYLLCSFFFVLGINLLSEKKFFSVSRNIKYILIGLIVLSVALAFFTNGNAFSWGGAVGELINAWLIKWIGKIGTGFLLTLIVLIYMIWRFNPSFRLPKRRTTVIQSAPAFQVNSFNDEAKLFVQDDNKISNNKLKNDSKNVTVIMPHQEETTINPLNDLSLVEKNGMEKLYDEELKAEKPKPSEVKSQKSEVSSDLNLEIKEIVSDDEDVIEEPSSFKKNPKSEIRNPTTDYEPTFELRNYKYPSLDLLETHGSEKIVLDATELEANKNQIISTLQNYDIEIQRIAATVGPTVTLYEIIPSPGVRISRIKNLEDDIALSLAALGIRIIAPIPGKGTIGIEVPNVRKTIVSMKTLLSSEKFQNNNFSLPIAIGKKIDNENFIVDLASMPHLLMAGATGQGKSVGINTILVSLLYKKHPSQLKFVLIDPKKVELSLYKIIEKHFLAKLPGDDEAIITDTKKVIYSLNALCIEMDNRYDLLKEAGCRNIKEYNEKFIKRKLNPQKGHQFLPFIVLIIDEFADLIMTAGKEIEMPIARLAQLARAVGIHLIIATQRPSVNIITGTIKANFPARIAFKVTSKIDSRTILDIGGAEQLIGKGDMLISYNGEISRLQCAFVDTPEVDKIVEFIGYQESLPEQYYLPIYEDEKETEGKNFDANDRDELFETAARLIVQNQIGSTSLLQRRMKLGYNRAGRLMDQLEAAGIVGKNLGSKARDVLVKTESELNDVLNNMV
ncbi:MAG: DNA translocase FtsK 4TM domain-containing protein [Chitinophagaceae bacterium]